MMLFFLSATLVAVLGFLLFAALASALSFRFASVAPVRGGTYFSLQRQRKVGKRKPLQTSGAYQDNATAHVL
ncbi:hypothetical protein PSAB6_310007 [Paraburkholderia sabiae]|nr:hypothetical protein PSAB6_310007 [Paraburkholderia sabiae]